MEADESGEVVGAAADAGLGMILTIDDPITTDMELSTDEPATFKGSMMQAARPPDLHPLPQFFAADMTSDESAGSGPSSRSSHDDDSHLRDLERRVSEKDKLIQSLQDRLETAELWTRKLETDRGRERADFAQERLRWEKQAFELDLDNKRRSARHQIEHQRTVSDLELRIKALESELRNEKSERIKRSMQDGAESRHYLAISQEPLAAIETLEHAKERIRADQAIIDDLRENVESCEELFNRLLVVNNNNTTDINEAKQLMLSGAAEFPDVIPTRWFCEASPDEVRTALLETSRRELSFKEFNDVLVRVDTTIRDASFDPFKRREGLVVGVDYDHMVIKNIVEDLGRPVADLIIEKKREVEKYCPSGCYPTEVLYEDDHELSLPEAVARLLHALKVLRNRLKRKKARYTLEPGAFRRQQTEDAPGTGNGGSTGPWTAWTSDNVASVGRNTRRESTVMDSSLQNNFRQWVTRSFDSVNGPTPAAQTSCVMTFLRKLLPAGQRVNTLEEARELLERHSEEFTREIEEGRAMGIRTALRRFRLFVRHEGQILEAFDEGGEVKDGGRGMDDDEDDWSDHDGADGSSHSRPLAQNLLERFARHLMEITSIQEVTIKDYTVKVAAVVKTIMSRVNYTGGQLHTEDQLVDFYKANSNTFIQYMQSLGTASADRAKRSALRYLMQYLGQVKDNPLWARYGGSGESASKSKGTEFEEEDDEERDMGMEEDEEEDGGQTRRGGISRDFQVLGPDTRRRFKRWLLEMTQGNTRPLAEATAREHCMSMNNLLRRIMIRVNAKPRVLDDDSKIRSFILANLAVFKAEASKLTYGRITAMRYFVRFVGIDKQVEGGADSHAETQQAADRSSSGGRRSEQLPSSSLPASQTVILPLSRCIRKTFKRYLKRTHGASTSGAKAQLQLVMGALGAVMADQKGGVQPLDRDGCICFIGDHEAALKTELRRASRSGHKAEGWQNFLRYIEGRLGPLPSEPVGATKRSAIEMEYSDDPEEIGVYEGDAAWAHDGSGGSQDPSLAGLGLLDGPTSEEFQSWLVENKPVASQTAFRYTRSFVRIVKKVMDSVGFKAPAAMTRDAISDFMEANQKIMEAEKASIQDKSAKAAIKYFYDFMKSRPSTSGKKRKCSSRGPSGPDAEVLGPERRKGFEEWCCEHTKADESLAATYATLGNRVLSRVWKREQERDAVQGEQSGSPTMSDEEFKAWLKSHEKKIAGLVGKYTASTRPATAMAYLWEYILNETWTQVPPRIEYQYLSDSSLEGEGLGYLHPIPIYKTQLGPDDDSSEEERLGLSHRRRSSTQQVATSSSILSTKLSHRLQRWLRRSGAASDVSSMDHLVRLCHSTLAEMLWRTESTSMQLKRLRDVRTLLQTGNSLPRDDHDAARSIQLLTRWLRDAENEPPRTEDDAITLNIPTSLRPSADKLVASLPAPSGTLSVHSISENALTGYVDWLWSPCATLVWKRPVKGAVVQSYATVLRAVVQDVMLDRGLSVYTLDSMSEIRDFFSGQQEALERVFRALEARKRASLAYVLAYLWEGKPHAERPQRLQALVSEDGDLAAGAGEEEEAEYDDAEVATAASSDVMSGTLEASLRSFFRRDVSQSTAQSYVNHIQSVLMELAAQDAHGCLVSRNADVVRLLRAHEDEVKEIVESTAWRRRSAVIGLLEFIKSAASDDEDEEDDDEEDDRSPEAVKALATRVRDDSGDERVLGKKVRWGFRRYLMEVKKKTIGDSTMDQHITAVSDLINIVMKGDLSITSLKSVAEAKQFVKANSGRITVELETCSSRGTKTAWQLFTAYLDQPPQKHHIHEEDEEGFPSSSLDDRGGRRRSTGDKPPASVDRILLTGFQRWLRLRRVDLDKKACSEYVDMVKASAQGVMLEVHGRRPERIKSLQKEDIRPFFEDNKQSFEEIWRRKKVDMPNQRLAWNLFLEYTSGDTRRASAESDSSSDDAADDDDEEDGAGGGGGGGGDTGGAVSKRAHQQKGKEGNSSRGTKRSVDSMINQGFPNVIGAASQEEAEEVPGDSDSSRPEGSVTKRRSL